MCCGRWGRIRITAVVALCWFVVVVIGENREGVEFLAALAGVLFYGIADEPCGLLN